LDFEFFKLAAENDDDWVLAVLKKENKGDRLLPDTFIDAEHAGTHLRLDNDEVAKRMQHQTTLRKKIWRGWPWEDYVVFAAFDDVGDIVQAVVRGPNGILPILCQSENEVLEVIAGEQSSGSERTSPSLRPRAPRGT
jgi:hypothetical protein